VNCPRAADCLWRTDRSTSCAAKPWNTALLPRSAARPSGAGSARTRYDHGGIVIGYSHATRLSPSRPVASWTSIYQRRWQGKALGPRDYVLCADEKTSIQARRRKHPSLPPAPDRPIYVEHEYARTGACAYIAAWDVHRAKLFGRCERRTGIAPFDRLVTQVMHEEPYRSARRVFWITDNGSSHRGQRAADRLRAKWSNVILIHTPVHASWLNQIEVYFSIVQRKLLSPNDFSTLATLKSDLLRFQQRNEKSAKPFEWTFTRRDLHHLLALVSGSLSVVVQR